MADPTVSQVYQTSIPQELLPYAQTLLDTASQFTDIEKNPYQQYQGERVAQISPLLQQSMDTASQMGVSGQIGAGSDIAGAAGLSALQRETFANPYAASAYMSPFMQNVVDVQQQQAKRQAAIQNQTQQAQATQAGAFGGSRDAIMRAQANAELQRNLQGIQATGLQNAFQQAQQQFNAEQDQRMKGLQAGLQAASTLGNLGQNQYQQTAGIVGLQGQLGQMEQQRAQDVLNAQYQDFLNYQNYPYKQLGFMSDLIRGTPTTQSASTIYQAPPTAMQNLMSLGLGTYGINQLTKGNAEGGMVKGYANGGLTAAYASGGSVMSPGFKRYAVGAIDPQQLPMAQQNALARGDRETADYATDEMALDAAIRRGIGAAFTPDMADSVIRAAGGGILAFAEPTEANNYGVTSSDDEEGGFDTLAALSGYTGAADPTLVNEARRRIAAIDEFKPQTVDPRDVERIRAARLAAINKELGPNTGMEGFRKYLGQAETDRGAALEQGKGLAALEAAGAVLQPGGTMRGLGAAGSAFAKTYGQVMQADRREKRALAEAGFHLADAERKERMGLMKEADAAEAAHRTSVKEANKFNFDKLNAQGKLTTELAKASRQLKGPGAGGGKPSTQAEGVAEYYNYFKELYPDNTEAQNRKLAMDKYLEMKGPGLEGVRTRTEATADEKARERAAKRALTDPEVNTALRKKDAAAADARRKAILEEELKAPSPKPGGQTGAITPEAFDKKWATLKSGESLVGPDGKVYIKQ